MALQDYRAPSLANYQAPGGLASWRAPDDGNIVTNTIKELGRDVYGAARVVGATGGEMWQLLTGAAPLTWEQLETRDIQGALMVSALAAGGFASAGARAALGVGKTALGRMGVTAGAEAVSGAAFGLIRPLDEDEDRMQAVMGDAIFNSALGAGASMARSAVIATIGAKIAGVKAAAARIEIAKTASLEHDKLIAREIAGVQLMNPTSGERMVIMRGADGKVRGATYSGRKKTSSIAPDELGDSFGQGIAQAIRAGFTSEMQPWKPDRTLKGLSSYLDPRVMAMIDATDGNIIDALGEIDIGQYASVRAAAQHSTDVADALDALGVEVLVPSTPLGDAWLPPNEQAALARRLGLKPTTPPAQLIREGVKRGAISLEGLSEGTKADDAMLELLVNGLQPEGSVLVTNQLRDLVGAMVLTSKRIARLHPEVQPIFDIASLAIHDSRTRQEFTQQWLLELKTKVSPEAAKIGVDLIDNTGAITAALLPKNATVAELEAARAHARAQSLAHAQALGNEEVVTFVSQVNDRMATYLGEMHTAGILTDASGRPGYFPIVNTNKWRLDIKNAGSIKFQGYHSTREAAQIEAQRVAKALGQPLNGVISPWSIHFEKTDHAVIDPSQLGKLRRTIMEGFTETLGDDDAAAAATKDVMGDIGVAASARKRSTPFAKQRVLGIRDFAEDPFDALETYSHSLDRTLALRTFEPQATQVVEMLAPEQKRLRKWATDYIDRVMGRPTGSELVFDNMLESMRQLGMPIDVAPRALSRWLGVVRKLETAHRLSNPFSAAINLTQIAMNTNAVLGVADTARGFGILTDLVGGANKLKRMKAAGLDLGVYLPDEGTLGIAFNSPTAALKEKRYAEALYRGSLFMFNGAERVNRMVTAWGAFNKALRDGASDKAAAQYAQTIVERTQFDYGVHNMPALLAGPVGGLLFQFKSFILNEIDFIASMSPKEAARFVTAASALGGLSQVMNLPGMDMVDLASGMFSDAKLSELMAIEAGEDESAIKRAFLFGIPGVLGADTSDYVGVGGISEITRSLFGPAVNDLAVFSQFVYDASNEISVSGFVSNETKNAFLQKALPAVYRRFEHGREIAATGEVRSPYTGKLIYRPEKRYATALLTAFGPPTLELQAERTADMVQMRRRENYLQARNSFTKDAAMALIEKRGDEAQEILRDARAHGHLIKPEDLRYWVKEMSTPADSRRERRTPQAQRLPAQRQLFQTTGLNSRPPELGG